MNGWELYGWELYGTPYNGAHLDVNGEQVCNKQWDLVERRQSSTWRELSAIL